MKCEKPTDDEKNDISFGADEHHDDGGADRREPCVHHPVV